VTTTHSLYYARAATLGTTPLPAFLWPLPTDPNAEDPINVAPADFVHLVAQNYLANTGVGDVFGTTFYVRWFADNGAGGVGNLVDAATFTLGAWQTAAGGVYTGSSLHATLPVVGSFMSIMPESSNNGNGSLVGAMIDIAVYTSTGQRNESLHDYGSSSALGATLPSAWGSAGLTLAAGASRTTEFANHWPGNVNIWATSTAAAADKILVNFHSVDGVATGTATETLTEFSLMNGTNTQYRERLYVPGRRISVTITNNDSVARTVRISATPVPAGS
jgi:hypothetical protein